jgi:hypothetical protein
MSSLRAPQGVFDVLDGGDPDGLALVILCPFMNLASEH